MSYTAPMDRMRERMMIFEVVRGESHTCCHLIEGMLAVRLFKCRGIW